MRRLVRSSLIVGVAVVFLVGIVACSGSSNAPDASRPKGSSNSSGSTITIKNFAFSPNRLKAKAGATVTVRNTDSTDHTVTADGGAFDTGHIHGGATATLKVTKPGTYPYHCDIHQFMKGVLEVTG
ncbi:MAG TPA: cupredoxin domain-containing protein [Acidimicrobiales bacterium]|nr:cupredoxin domain-containing protein [Acidimicrobiales bacterium]